MLTEEQQNDLKQLLLRLRAELMGDSDFMADEALRGDSKENSGNLSAVPQRMADRGSDFFDQAFPLSRLQDANDLIVQIDDALDRMERGTYGQCDECGEPIGMRRLQIRPYAALCVACKQREEDESA